MKKRIKSPRQPSHFKDLLLLFSIPIGTVVVVAAVIYIPKLLANPKYDFIYSICEAYLCEDRYLLNEGGEIAKEPLPSSIAQYGYGDKRTVRYYDITEDESRPLTLEEAQVHSLDGSSRSPDGYVLDRETSSSGFLLWSSYSDGWYLKNGSKKKEIELGSASTSYYEHNVELIGWVKK